MLYLAFFAMAVLHFGGIVTLPLWLVFLPLAIAGAIWVTIFVGWLWLR